MTVKEDNMTAIHDREWCIKDAMKKNHGRYMILGGLYIGYKWISVLYFLLYASHIPLLLVTIYLCKDDFTVISEDVHFLILLTLTFTTMVSHLINREKIDNIFEAMGRNYYDYDNTLDPGSLKRISVIHGESTARKNMLKRVFTVGVCVAVVGIAIGRPLLQYYLSETGLTKQLPPGVDGAMITFIYYPWGLSNYYVNTLAYFIQIIFTLITTNIVLGIDLVFYNMGETLCEQLEILGISLRRVRQRASHIVNGEIAKEKSLCFKKAQRLCLKHSVKHHQVIIRIFEDLKSVFYLALLWLIMGATFLLCMAGMVFTADVPLISKAVFATFITAELMHTYLLCWSGERIASLSENLPWNLYSNVSYDCSSEILVYHRMLSMRCTRPLQLTAGGFTKINRNTFLEVIRTSFSYINLLQASNSRSARIDSAD